MTDKPRRGRPPKTTAEDWERAALDAVAAGGVASVSVEALAVGLGTTKGSFYWHFANREALIEAALHRWEAEHTERLAGYLDTVADPMERLRYTFPGSLADQRGSAVALTLLADAEDPSVGAAIARVTARRVAVLERAFADLGFTPGQARTRAQTAYAIYLGTAALRRGAPDSAPEPDADYAATVLEILTTAERG
ncbi:TetR/AcrR family transcriptional regulator [Catenulispora yoronensis]|uniref:TetR/AcrR family transcriptional regulator n=1 Tax=Catenulispora yoronensis TaxID=450799 RepID=A0ABN2V377_9ACTN